MRTRDESECECEHRCQAREPLSDGLIYPLYPQLLPEALRRHWAQLNVSSNRGLDGCVAVELDGRS